MEEKARAPSLTQNSKSVTLLSVRLTKGASVVRAVGFVHSFMPVKSTFPFVGLYLILMRNLARLTLAAIAVAGVGIAIPALAQVEQEILCGRTAAGELKVVSDFAQPVELPGSIFPGIPGYATGELAFHSTILDDATNDFFQLSTAADFRLVLLAKQPGVEIWNDTGTGFMDTNESFFIGSAPFDTHPIWNIVAGTPGSAYSLTLKLRDVTGLYPESAPMVLSFTPTQVRYPINLQPVDAGHATLLWPTNAVGWELQAATSLMPTNWTTITSTPGLAGTNFTLNIATTERQQFFRLHQP